MQEIVLRKKDGFTISTDRELLQIGVIQDYLANESYWAKDRTKEQTEKAIDNSVCFGLYKGDEQIGLARVVTDLATFAYLGDVFILPAYQGRGLGKWLMEVVIDHPDLQGLRRWVLATRDAHDLYGEYGFSALKHPERWMEMAAPGAY